MFFQNSTG